MLTVLLIAYHFVILSLFSKWKSKRVFHFAIMHALYADDVLHVPLKSSFFLFFFFSFFCARLCNLDSLLENRRRYPRSTRHYSLPSPFPLTLFLIPSSSLPLLSFPFPLLPPSPSPQCMCISSVHVYVGHVCNICAYIPTL